MVGWRAMPGFARAPALAWVPLRVFPAFEVCFGQPMEIIGDVRTVMMTLGRNSPPSSQIRVHLAQRRG